MTTAPLLTLIVPAYQAVEHLSRTLDLYLKNAFSEIEVLIINDGSTDQTGEVAERIASQSLTTMRVIHQDNLGHGGAINTGVQNAQGTFVKVVDADDTLHEAGVRVLLETLKTNPADLVLSPYETIDQSTGERHTYQMQGLKAGECYTYDQYLALGNAVPAMHSITYRRKLLIDAQVTLRTHAYYVDMLWNIYPMRSVQSISYSPEPCYQYKIGQANQSVSSARYIANRHMHEQVISDLIDYLQVYSDYLTQTQFSAIDQQINRLIAVQVNIYLSMTNYRLSHQEYQQFIKGLRVAAPQLAEQSYGRKATLLRRYPWLYPVIYAGHQLFNQEVT